jgi:(2R)-3-sulfolactate dehydrogenase (NADP+)
MLEAGLGVLAGAGVSHQVGGTFVASDRPSNVGHSFLAIDPGAFGGGFGERIEMLCDMMRASEPADPAVPVRVPGDRRHRLRTEAQASGIEVGDELRAELDKLAAELGVPPLSA